MSTLLLKDASPPTNIFALKDASSPTVKFLLIYISPEMSNTPKYLSLMTIVSVTIDFTFKKFILSNLFIPPYCFQLDMVFVEYYTITMYFILCISTTSKLGCS